MLATSRSMTRGEGEIRRDFTFLGRGSERGRVRRPKGDKIELLHCRYEIPHSLKECLQQISGTAAALAVAGIVGVALIPDKRATLPLDAYGARYRLSRDAEALAAARVPLCGVPRRNANKRSRAEHGRSGENSRNESITSLDATIPSDLAAVKSQQNGGVVSIFQAHVRTARQTGTGRVE